jgi:SAM-dependent methyltransferase
MPQHQLSERSRGLYALLRNPRIYSTLQRVLSRGSDTQATFVQRHIRAEQSSAILDFGAGTGAIRSALPESAHYIAVEPNPHYCGAMRTTFGNDGAVIECGGVEKLEQFHEVADIVLILAVLHHVDDEEAARIISAARGALRPDGRLVTIDPCYHDRQNPVARLLARVDRGKYVRTPHQYASIAKTDFHNVQVFVETDNLRVPYSHCVLECQN